MILEELLAAPSQDGRPGRLRVVFCGTAASSASARQGCYYAGPGNRFWPTLFAVGLTPRQLEPREFRDINAWGLGLTDVIRDQSGMDSQIRFGDFQPELFWEKLNRAAPQWLAFTSKKAASVALRVPSQRLSYGPWEGSHLTQIGIFVLPSPSGAARASWDIRWWSKLANLASCSSPVQHVSH